ncbi:hypothetical protein N0V94_007568 [Neodidymelliopsis sp. IMI 364377]|nr:hypothetical protein N0V94_007568 [Neodidymelliopsis sp. IMI 364377]
MAALNDRLTILGDKLALLQDLIRKSSDQKPDPASVEELINKLILDAKATGISRDTFVSFKVEHMIGRST